MSDYKTFPGVDMTEECPVHGAATVKEYDFGRNQDATLYKYACGCCSVYKNTGFNDDGILYPDYNSAAGAARMTVARENAFANRHGF